MFQMSEKTRQARANLRTAITALADVDETHDCEDECDAYLAANSAVIEAERALPWWKRLDIELTA